MNEAINQIITQLTNSISMATIFDILIMSFIIYKILGFIKESRAGQLVKGLLLIIAATVLSDWFKLYTLNWILDEAMTIGILALVILFQPELRRGLEQVGRTNITSSIKTITEGEGKQIIEELLLALDSMSSKKIGALIVIERVTALDDIANTGTFLDAKITAQLLENLFYSGSPLHDGAVIFRGTKILSAGCVLPLTENPDLPKELGTRHRAGIGITENSDAVAIMVSEETGGISITDDGNIKRKLSLAQVEKELASLFTVEKTNFAKKFFSKNRKKGGNTNV